MSTWTNDPAATEMVEIPAKELAALRARAGKVKDLEAALARREETIGNLCDQIDRLRLRNHAIESAAQTFEAGVRSVMESLGQFCEAAEGYWPELPPEREASK